MKEPNKLHFFMCYPNAKVEYSLAVVHMDNCLSELFLHGTVYGEDFKDCTLLLRSLDSMTEKEKEEYLTFIGFPKYYEATFKNNYIKYDEGDGWRTDSISTDWLRLNNFVTPYLGQDLKQFYKIDNKAYLPI